MKLQTFMVLLLCIGVVRTCSCSAEPPEFWEEHERFYRICYQLAHYGDMIEVKKLCDGEYPEEDSDFIREYIPKKFGFVYIYPPRYGPGPFDLIYIGSNSKLEGGDGDDIPLWRVAKRLCDEEGCWGWYPAVSSDTQPFYKEWLKRTAKQSKGK